MIVEQPVMHQLHWHTACDPTEPMLADHRPGGHPLLGTVGNLDMIATGLASRVPRGHIVAIEDIRLGPPLIFATAAPIRLGIAAETRAEGIIHARSFSGAAPAVTHLEASFTLALAFAPAPPFAAPPPRATAMGVAEVYAVLFHGPALRVIDRVDFLGTSLVATSATALPPLHRHSPTSPLAPRAIEFGLQSAGLLQLALDGSMAIPLAIEHIARFADTDVGMGTKLTAHAERMSDGRFTISVGNAGATIVQIMGYATTPLPFAHDNHAATMLANRLTEGLR